MNNTRLQILKHSIIAALGLMLFALGVYLTIQANLGVEPWTLLNIGLAKQLGILYGNASIIASLTILCIDLFLKEKIGIGTLLDAVVVGKTVDLLNWLNLLPTQNHTISGVLFMLIGFLIMGCGQYIYMRAGLSCGPRDALLVAMGKKLYRLPIGIVNIMLLSAALLAGWALGGPIGIGTVIAPFGIGLMQQLVFHIVKFEPRDVQHQDIVSSGRVLFQRNSESEQ